MDKSSPFIILSPAVMQAIRSARQPYMQFSGPSPQSPTFAVALKQETSSL